MLKNKKFLFFKYTAIAAGAACSWLLIAPDDLNKEEFFLAPSVTKNNPTESKAKEVFKTTERTPQSVAEEKIEKNQSGLATSSDSSLGSSEEKDFSASMKYPAPQRYMASKNWQLPEKGTGKIPKQLVWTRARHAHFYEIQISQNKDRSGAKTFYRKKHFFPIEVFANQDYYWRVRSLDINKEPLSDFSETYHFNVSRDHSASQSHSQVESSSRGLANTPEEEKGHSWQKGFQTLKGGSFHFIPNE